MISSRLIPIVLLRDRLAFKSIGFSDYVYISDPINLVRIYSDLGADEIIILDPSARRKQNSLDLNYLEKLFSSSFVPVTYGGGIKSLSDAVDIASIGAEKVCINYKSRAALNLIHEISPVLGRQSIVFSLNISRDPYLIYNYRSKKLLDEDLISVIRHAHDAGIGETLLSSYQNDGHLQGLDINLIHYLRKHITTPLIITGGANSRSNLISACKAGADAIATSHLTTFQTSSVSSILPKTLNHWR